MNKTLMLALAGSGMLGVGSFCVSYYASTRGPRVQCPEVVDLGVQELGRRLTTHFPVRNAGSETLVLQQTRNSCGCLSVMAKGEHGMSPAERFEVGPGKEVSLLVEVSSRGRPGGSLRESVTYATNDLARPEVTVEFIILLQGQVVAVPTALHLGEVIAGETVAKVVELRDMGRKDPFALAEVESSCPGLIRVTDVTAVSDAPESSSQPRAGRPLYQLKVQVRAPQTPGRLDESLTVRGQGDGAPSLKVPISANVVAMYRLSPPALVLPRSTDAGPIYRASTTCLCAAGKPFKVLVSEVPKGLTVSLGERQTDGGIPVTVECQDGQTPAPGRSVVRLMVSRAEESHELELPVLCWRPQE